MVVLDIEQMLVIRGPLRRASWIRPGIALRYQ
jgi:hypothetical protein